MSYSQSMHVNVCNISQLDWTTFNVLHFLLAGLSVCRLANDVIVINGLAMRFFPNILGKFSWFLYGLWQADRFHTGFIQGKWGFQVRGPSFGGLGLSVCWSGDDVNIINVFAKVCAQLQIDPGKGYGFHMTSVRLASLAPQKVIQITFYRTTHSPSVLLLVLSLLYNERNDRSQYLLILYNHDYRLAICTLQLFHLCQV